jgi:hydrogenase maturation protease
MPRTLIIGYGNLDRADDGVAYFVINSLRRRLGQAALREDNTGLEELGAQTDSIFLTQLVPELIDTLADYDQVIFVDAHVREDVPDLHCTAVLPEYTPSAFTHHVTPAMLLALLHALHHREPAAHIVSIRGYDFDFHRGLSAATRTGADQAVEHILQSTARIAKLEEHS